MDEIVTITDTVSLPNQVIDLSKIIYAIRGKLPNDERRSERFAVEIFDRKYKSKKQIASTCFYRARNIYVGDCIKW